MCWMWRPAVGVQFNASDLFMLKNVFVYLIRVAK